MSPSISPAAANLSAQSIQNLAPVDDVALDDTTNLTPDALMSYCRSRIDALDTSMWSAIHTQKQSIAASEALSGLMAKLGDIAKDGVHGENRADVKAAIQAARDALPPGTDASVTGALDSIEKSVGRDLDGDHMKESVIEPLNAAKQDLSNGAELNMINVQSLMSQRQTAIQLTTNLVQSLNDQINKVAANVGH